GISPRRHGQGARLDGGEPAQGEDRHRHPVRRRGGRAAPGRGPGCVNPADARAAIESFLRESPGRFALLPDDDGRGARILEAGTGKTLGVRWDEIAEAVAPQRPVTAGADLVVAFTDGRPLRIARRSV